MFTTAGVTRSSTGASVGTPSRSGKPAGICADAATQVKARNTAAADLDCQAIGRILRRKAHRLYAASALMHTCGVIAPLWHGYRLALTRLWIATAARAILLAAAWREERVGP